MTRSIASNLNKNEEKIIFLAENFELKPRNQQIFSKALIKKQRIDKKLRKLHQTEYMKKHNNIKNCTVNLEKLDVNEYITIAPLKRKLSKPYNLRHNKIKFIEKHKAKHVKNEIPITYKCMKKHHNIKNCTIKLDKLDLNEYISIAQLKRNLSKPYNLRPNKLKFIKKRGTIHIVRINYKFEQVYKSI